MSARRLSEPGAGQGKEVPKIEVVQVGVRGALGWEGFRVKSGTDQQGAR